MHLRSCLVSREPAIDWYYYFTRWRCVQHAVGKPRRHWRELRWGCIVKEMGSGRKLGGSISVLGSRQTCTEGQAKYECSAHEGQQKCSHIDRDKALHVQLVIKQEGNILIHQTTKTGCHRLPHFLSVITCLFRLWTIYDNSKSVNVLKFTHFTASLEPLCNRNPSSFLSSTNIQAKSTTTKWKLLIQSYPSYSVIGRIDRYCKMASIRLTMG